MKSFFTVAALAAVALGMPSLVERQATPVCSGTYDNAVCCAVNVLDVLDLNCVTPPSTPTDAADFTNICAAEGQEAQCCALPLLGQGLLCEYPTGGT